ncbi:MAG: phage late control D family protein [Chloroflexota bacterium]
MPQGVAIAIGGSPDAELGEGATLVEVHERVGQATTFRLQYGLEIRDGDLPLLTDDRLGPGSEVSVLVPAGDSAQCLVKGPVHGQSIHLEHGGAGSTLEVTGSDTTVVMDRENRATTWNGVRDSDVAMAILGGYGYVPDVDPTPGLHQESGHVLAQRASDLRFLRRLATRNGYLLWVTCDAFGIETAHFKRPALEGGGNTEVIINLDSSNVDALDIEWDVERPTSVVGAQLDLKTKSDMGGAVGATPNTILGAEGLQDISSVTRSAHVSAPADDSGELQARGEGALFNADWFVTAATETTLDALGALVRAHTLVTVRGAGSRHSGDYLVAGVRHTIDSSSHRMEIELVRNGWGV